MKWIFFGTDSFAVTILQELQAKGFVPTIVVCAPDLPLRRNKGFQAPATKVWADANKIETMQPSELDEDFISALQEEVWDLFIVASYGKIISHKILNIPNKGTINVHPSLLPKYRGASPIETAIIDDCKNTGVTIMEMDAKMDHGPIIFSIPYTFKKWPTSIAARQILASIGGTELARIIPQWMKGKIKSVDQDHSHATFTRKFSKDDAEINLENDGYDNFRKFQAFHSWNDVFFFVNTKKTRLRVIIKEAQFLNDKFIVEKVIPEGRKEMTYQQLLNFIK